MHKYCNNKAEILGANLSIEMKSTHLKIWKWQNIKGNLFTFSTGDFIELKLNFKNKPSLSNAQVLNWNLSFCSSRTKMRIWPWSRQECHMISEW